MQKGWFGDYSEEISAVIPSGQPEPEEAGDGGKGPDCRHLERRGEWIYCWIDYKSKREVEERSQVFDQNNCRMEFPFTEAKGD